MTHRPLSRSTPLLAPRRFGGLLTLVLLAGCVKNAAPAGPPATPPGAGAASAFPDHDGRRPPPEQYQGPFFELSQDYPRTLPEPGAQPWLSIDPRSDTDAYLLAVRDYFYEGMIAVDVRGQQGAVRKWYQVPWMHVGDSAREAIRGLTFERRSRPLELGPKQTETQQNWGTGFYNPVGGYVVGKVWADGNDPRPRASQFLEGTVVVKILFSAAPLEQVPDLTGSPTWRAYIREQHDGGPGGARKMADVRLLQMDIAVKDARAGTTGWFFGSLVYHRERSGLTAWHKLAPGGLQWGNDPGLDQAAYDNHVRVTETRISGGTPPLTKYKKEMGWLGRLNGPVDNQKSACMSCHSTAQWPAAPMLPGEHDDRMKWFRNLRGDQPFLPGATPLDFSLQIALSLQNFCAANPAAPACAGLPATPPSEHFAF